MKLSLLYKLGLSVFSGLILSIGWTQAGIGWIVFLGFVPLLLVMESIISSDNKIKLGSFFGFSLITFVVWNTVTSWWIYHATLPGAIAAVLLSSVFMATVMLLFMSVFLNMGRRTGYIAFVAFWISFEYIFMNSQLSWPWLILGNAFANNIKLIQWYEFVGHIGGSFWVLIINLLIYEILRFIITGLPKAVIIKYFAILLIVITVPITYSFIRYYQYNEVQNPVDIVVIQPNIDSYVEKFVLPVEDQIDNIIELAESKADENVDYFVAPETAIPNGMWKDEIINDRSILMLKSFIKKYPQSKFVIGADTRLAYFNGEGRSITAREYGDTGHYYDLFNTAIQLDTSDNVQIYYKSKLVPGVEMMPYPKLFGWLEDLMIDLGGMTGSHGTQDERSLMTNDLINTAVGVPICYESVYGEFVGQWVKNGANILFVITNDGWWEDTPGHRQHNSYSRIRAIETRRSIARSANTGISCFINQRGDVLQHLGWAERGALRQTLNANDKITFYVRYGDFVARMAMVFAAILLVVLFVNYILKRVKKS